MFAVFPTMHILLRREAETGAAALTIQPFSVFCTICLVVCCAFLEYHNEWGTQEIRWRPNRLPETRQDYDFV